MSDPNERRRWVNLGELIALAALIVSALGVWIAWKSSNHDGPTRVVEQRSAIPLALRATPDGDGRSLTIAPADPAHALQSLKITIKGAPAIEVGSDGRLMASDVEDALEHHVKEPKDVTLSVPVRIDAHYVEAGDEKRSAASYTLRYRWQGGGLFGGRSLQLVGLSR
jgi:hypothetical protein